MGVSADDQAKIRTIIQKLIQNDKQWLRDQAILVGDKGQSWILNYIQGPRSEYNRLVRGMVVAKPQPGFQGDPLKLIKSFPFTRFFNHGEQDAAHVDFGNADMIEKMDGTMVGVYFPDENPRDPHYHTRKMVSSHADDMTKTIRAFNGNTYNLMGEIGKYVKSIPFTEEDVRNTYVFEFVHAASAVVTKYQPEQYGLYLLAARNLDSHTELTQRELDQVAARLGVRRPKRWDSFADFAEIKRMLAQAAAEVEDFEGFVFQDRQTGNRLKLKDPAYVEKHHMIDNLRMDRLMVKVLEGEEDEILTYKPQAKEKIDQIKKAYSRYFNHVMGRIAEWRAKGLNGRELSVALFGENPLSKWELKLAKMRGEPVTMKQVAEPDSFVRDMILKTSKLPDNEVEPFVDRNLKQVALGQGKNEGSPKTLMDMIGLNAIEDEEDIGEM